MEDLRVDFTADDGLKAHDGTRCHDDRIDQTMGHGSMAASSVERNAHAISSAHNQSPTRSNDSRTMRHDMRAKHNIRNGHIVAIRIIEAIINHSLRAGAALLGRLEGEYQRARPVSASSDQSFRSA